MLKFKRGSYGADISLATPEIVIAIMVANDVFASRGEDCFVNELRTKRAGVHMAGSKHDKSGAIDITTSHIASGLVRNIAEEIRENIPDGYDVILEDTHIHIEHDPKEKPYHAS